MCEGVEWSRSSTGSSSSSRQKLKCIQVRVVRVQLPSWASDRPVALAGRAAQSSWSATARWIRSVTLQGRQECRPSEAMMRWTVDPVVRALTRYSACRRIALWLTLPWDRRFAALRRLGSASLWLKEASAAAAMAHSGS